MYGLPCPCSIRVGDDTPNDDVPPPFADDWISQQTSPAARDAYAAWLDDRIRVFDRYLLGKIPGDTTGALYTKLMETFRPWGARWFAFYDPIRTTQLWEYLAVRYDEIRQWHKDLIAFEAQARAIGMQQVPGVAPVPVDPIPTLPDIGAGIDKAAGKVLDVLEYAAIAAAVIGVGYLAITAIKK